MVPVYIENYVIRLPYGLKVSSFPASGLMRYVSNKPMLEEEEKTLPVTLFIINKKSRGRRKKKTEGR